MGEILYDLVAIRATFIVVNSISGMGMKNVGRDKGRYERGYILYERIHMRNDITGLKMGCSGTVNGGECRSDALGR